MKSKLKIRTIEDIALQYIKRAEPRKKQINNKENIINTFKTLIDYKFCLKNNTNYNLLEDKENIQPNGNNKKTINLYKIPQKFLNEEEDSFNKEFNSNNESVDDIISKKTIKLISGDDIKLRDIVKLQFDENLFFNLSYQNIYDSITEIYNPLLTNFRTISSLKSMTNNTLSCIEFFFNHDSVFDLIQQRNDNYFNDILISYLDQLKIFEFIEMDLILFIMHIISEIKIEYIDNFSEDDIFIIYKDCLLVLQKFYEIIILIILSNDLYNKKNAKTGDMSDENKNKNDNKDSISFETLCLKYVKDFYKFSQKPNDLEKIIEKINENVSIINKSLFNSTIILYGNLVLFKNYSNNIENPDITELIFINKFSNNNSENNKLNSNSKEKIFLSKEFQDQYTIYKTIYLFFTYNDNITPDYLNSSLKEISNLFLLYFTNYKNLIEKNKVYPPFLPPMDKNKYKYSLVLDLDETLVHYIEEENKAYVQVRPYADFFLNEMAKYFELIIFTAASEDYADIVLNELDKNKVIKYKLYRKHTEQVNGIFVKDLKKIGRDLDKTLIVDNNKDNFSLQPENGLHICSFIGDQNDDELYNLSEDLMKIVRSNKEDIRPIIKEIQEIMNNRYQNKEIILE